MPGIEPGTAHNNEENISTVDRIADLRCSSVYYLFYLSQIHNEVHRSNDNIHLIINDYKD